MNIKILKALLYASAVATGFASQLSSAQTASQFEVGTATLPITITATATTLSPFTSIAFATPFAAGTTPNVFPMTPEFGAGVDDDPCIIRIRNVTNTGFDAACLEPINEDRNGPAVNFDYVAMINGTLNVPIVGSADTVRFESRCSSVSTQFYGNNCDDCGGETRSYTTQSFLSPAFTNPPALLTQISTTNNLIDGTGNPIGEPEFLDVTIESNTLTGTNFNWTLERMEAGNGTLGTVGTSTNETVCYLAVEQDGCQELDFSSFGGPASVDFAAVSGDNVDGHDNGATTGEGVTFPMGCFSNTPVVLGGKVARNGADGGFLRLVSQNSTEAIFTIDEDRISNPERGHIDEDITALAFSSTFTTPVTLSKAQVTQLGRKTTFDWETSSETFHLGFHLWGESQSGWEQLNNRLILGAELDTAQTSRYEHTIKLSRTQLNEISRFGISTIDNTGFEQFYGPFEVGTEYGEDANNEPVDWAETRTAFEQNMRARGFVKKNNRWRRASERVKQRLLNKELGANSSVVNLEFQDNGIHAVSAQDILNIVPQWQGVSLNRIALTLNGQAAPRDIVSRDEHFDAADQIILNVREPEGQDAVYLNTYTYQLKLDRSRAQTASTFDGTAHDDNDLQTSAMVSVTATSDKVYSAGIDADAPWYDRRLVSRGQATTADYPLSFPYPIDTNTPSILDVTLFGGIDLDGDVDDHHAQIWVNGSLVDDAVFDGLTRYSKRVALPAGLLKQDNNTVSVTVVGDTGLFADLILIDELTLSAPEVLNGRADYRFFATEQDLAYQVALPNAASASIYAYTRDGLLTQIKGANTDSTVSFSALPGISQLRSDLRFSVSQNQDLPQPAAIELSDIKLQHDDLGNLLIVAHPSFMGEELDAYAQFKKTNGYRVSIVDWLALVETYGFGNNTPQALDNFLARALPADERADNSLNNVLLVGGHTYDYLGNLDDNIVNFIPTHYRKVSIFDFTPSDNVFADLDNDQIPELAIGRWPVRTPADLSTIIKKTLDWQANRDATPYQNALLISQPSDSSGLNFTQQMDRRLGVPLSRINEFDQVSHISMQALSDSGIEDPVQTARSTLESQLNDGVELLSFGGHGGYVSWGFQGVVNTDFVKNLSNQGKPTLVMPLACYTSNYEHPSVNTLAHQWLFAGDKGAVGIHGAAVLGEYRENAIFAERYLNNSATSKTVGEAIFKAKNEMASGNQMLHNWAFLGDPTLPLR